MANKPVGDERETREGSTFASSVPPHLPLATDAKDLFKPHMPFDNETQLRRAYLKLAMRFHPDKWPQDDRADATQLFQAIGEAYQQLLNPKGLPPPSVRRVKTRTAVVAERGDLSELRRLLAEDAARACEDDDNRATPLMFAARGGSVASAELLLQHGADLQARNLGGWSALLFAALGNRVDMVRFLLARGAEVRENDLLLTAYRGSAGSLEEMLDQSAADPASVRRMRDGKTLLHLVCDGMIDTPRDDPERYSACVDLLLRKGLSVDVIDDKKGYTCLQGFVGCDTEWHSEHYQESPAHLSFLEQLCRHGASPTAKNRHGISALSIAADSGLDCVRSILRRCVVAQSQHLPRSSL